MSDTPKFEVIDRRKFKAKEEQESGNAGEHETPSAPEPSTPATPSAGGPRLVVNQGNREDTAPEPLAQQIPPANEIGPENEPDFPNAPTPEESHEQKAAYDASARRLEDLIRAQNPGAGAQPPVTFDHLVQQFYLSAMIQMGAGAQEGQRPQVDIVGARNTIDMLGILAHKTRGNLTEAEDRTLQTVLFDLRMAFLELTSMIKMPSVQPPPPKR